jgi:hypothetical protein
MAMTQSPLLEQNPQHFLEGLDALSYRLSEAEVREDPALCMVCLRWATEGHECREKYRCAEGYSETGQLQPHF